MFSALTPESSRIVFRSTPPGFLFQLHTIAAKELRESLRNRWFLIFAGLFATLICALSYISMAGVGSEGMAGFGRTASGLINLILLIVPLMALTVGAGAIAGERERETLEYLLSHPISRGELLLGKFFGSAVALGGALTLGFGASLLVIASRARGQSAASFLSLALATYILALAMLSVGMLVSVLCRRSSVAVGVGILIWFTMAFLSDLGMMGSALIFHLRVQELFGIALINPMQVFKMSVLGSVNASLDVLGPAGVYATREYGSKLPCLFAAVAGAWVFVPGSIAYVLFTKRGGA